MATTCATRTWLSRQPDSSRCIASSVDLAESKVKQSRDAIVQVRPAELTSTNGSNGIRLVHA